MLLNETQQAIQDSVRDFAQDRIRPKARDFEKAGGYPKELFEELATLGLMGMVVPEEMGGTGADTVSYAVSLIELAAADGPLSTIVSVQNSLVASGLVRSGTPAQRERFLPGLVSGKTIGAFALTEADAGSDAGAIRSRATRQGNGYVLNGTKQFTSGGGVNDVYVVMVRTGADGPSGISCLVVDKDTPGFSFGAPERKLGWNASPTAQLIFADARVPVANLVGREGEGFRFAMAGLDGGRLNIGACSLGGAQRCLDEAVGYVRERRQFGQAIAQFQNTQFTLADMASELEAARALLYLAAAKVTASAPDKTVFCAMAKKLATDTGSAVVDRALQLFGGYGYLRDYPIERFWRDLRVHRILEGTNEVMRMIIGRDLLR